MKSPRHPHLSRRQDMAHRQRRQDLAHRQDRSHRQDLALRPVRLWTRLVSAAQGDGRWFEHLGTRHPSLTLEPPWLRLTTLATDAGRSSLVAGPQVVTRNSKQPGVDVKG